MNSERAIPSIYQFGAGNVIATDNGKFIRLLMQCNSSEVDMYRLPNQLPARTDSHRLFKIDR